MDYTLFDPNDALEDIRQYINRLTNKISELNRENKREIKKNNNEAWIKNMSTDELADYLYSVYITGIMVGKNSIEIKNEEIIDYRKWLEEERKDK